MSTKKTDRRILHSKRFIREGLIDLLSTKTIDKISVLHLCNTADINRKTFYAHYSTPEDVLVEIENDIIKDIKNILEQYTIENYLPHFFEFIKNNQYQYKILIRNRSSRLKENLTVMMEEYCYSHMMPEETFPDRNSAKIFLTYSTAGAVAITDTWLDSGCIQTPEEVSALISALTAGAMEKYSHYIRS